MVCFEYEMAVSDGLGCAGSEPGKLIYLLGAVYVGNKCLSPLQKDLANVGTGMVGTQVQLFVPAVQMKPEIEQDYFATNRVKEVKYNDYYTFTINKESAKAGQSFN